MPFLILALLAAAPEGGAGPAKERLVCRGEQRTTGSRIRAPRRCRTAEAWRQDDEKHARTPISMRVTEGQADPLAGTRPN
ncbi:MAG: hypothetical protein E6G94_14160 [Alphaproteobacteria bacterium]|nr:MAG: hypothetical protein E6G94_14160 [Alphaproteobacteria bacterium]